MIPAGLRFQVGLPFPSSALNGFKADFAGDYPVAERAYEELVGRELVRLMSRDPGRAISRSSGTWPTRSQDIEGVLAWTAEGAWERFAGPVARLTPQIPEDVLVGYHFCYGTFPEWPMYEARDMSLLVRMANYAVANSGPHGRLGAHGGAALPAQRGRALLPAAESISRWGTRACSSGSCCRSTALPASAGATPPRRGT